MVGYIRMRKKPSSRSEAQIPTQAVAVPQDKLSFDSHLVNVYLTGLQSEVEAKVRRVAKFREQMRKIDAAGGQTDRPARARAARVLIGQIKEMLVSNLMVRETLQELLTAAEAVLDDLRHEAMTEKRAESPRSRGAAPGGNPGARLRSTPPRAGAATSRKG